jgi:hypothetical protein
MSKYRLIQSKINKKSSIQGQDFFAELVKIQ